MACLEDYTVEIFSQHLGQCQNQEDSDIPSTKIVGNSLLTPRCLY